MPTSDSDDFESADEGQSSVEKKQRKKRLSSSNYSDNSLETDPKTQKNIASNVAKETPKNDTDGWDEFEIDETPIEETVQNKNFKITSQPTKTETSKESTKSQDTGWDDFGDWGDETTTVKESPKPPPEADIKEVTNRLAAASTTTNSGGWGWGWGVDSLLSTASAGISNITSHVSQGISTVLETGIGIPEPEELAKQSKTGKENQSKPNTQPAPQESRTAEPSKNEQEVSGSGDAFPFGSLLSGVTKFVESTGTKVIAGGLGTLETIGKKTMEVLQDGDPGLAKKRAMLGLDSGEKLVLSQVLREAKAKAEEEDRIKEEKREAKEVHYENLFDDFEGLVHLEALEMLSRQVTMRIEERTRGASPEKRQDIKETLQQVAELCEMPEEDDDDEETSDDQPRPDALHDRLQTATQDLGLKLLFQPLVKQYTDILASLDSQAELTEKSIYKRAVSGLAQATALCVELYHKTAEMLLVKPRRSTADEADALTQMTVVLTKHISELATLFTEKLNSIPTENKEQVNTYITNIFLEAGNSSTYVQNAFQLALPILQIGAV